jgi:TRAP-type C4-dicarboxylate transport system permease small subunit
MSGSAAPETGEQSYPLGRVLGTLSRALALLGGAFLVMLAAVVVASIGGRALHHPLLGDFELVQFGCSVAIAFFLPYCQWRRAHLIVDFFTLRASPGVRRGLDALGDAVLAAVMALLAWRVGVGALELRAAHETSALLGIPTWWSYAAIAPAFALTALVALYTAWLPRAQP